MAINQHGIAISIRAFLPMGKSLDAQLDALNLVKTAHETGDYAALLKAAQDVEVKTESKTRRVDDKPAPAAEPAPVALAEPEPGALPFDVGPTEARGKKKANGNE